MLLSQYSKPCRIAEAEAALREVLRYAQAKGARRNVAPELYLAVAIHKIPEKEQEALSMFASAFDHYEEHGDPALGPRSELWARASWSRLLRRVERVRDAEVQEKAIVYVQSLVLLIPLLRRVYMPGNGLYLTRWCCLRLSFVRW